VFVYFAVCRSQLFSANMTRCRPREIPRWNTTASVWVYRKSHVLAQSAFIEWAGRTLAVDEVTNLSQRCCCCCLRCCFAILTEAKATLYLFMHGENRRSCCRDKIETCRLLPLPSSLTTAPFTFLVIPSYIWQFPIWCFWHCCFADSCHTDDGEFSCFQCFDIVGWASGRASCL